VTAAATQLGIAPSTLLRWLNDGFVAGEQLTPGARVVDEHARATRSRPSRGSRPAVHSLREPPSQHRKQKLSSRLTCPSVPVVAVRRRSKAHPPTSACFRSPAPSHRQARYPASYTKPTGWKDRRSTAPLSCCLSATGIRFLGVLFPPRDSASLTVGLPPHPSHERLSMMDPDGVSTFHTHELRPGRVQLYPGSGGVHTTVDPCSVAACRFSTARSSSSPPPRPDPGSCRNEASPLVHSRSPFRSSPHL